MELIYENEIGKIQKSWKKLVLISNYEFARREPQRVKDYRDS